MSDDNGDQFDWLEDIDLQEQPRTAIYWNFHQSVVIRQEGTGFESDDQIVFFATKHALQAVIQSLQLKLEEM